MQSKGRVLDEGELENAIANVLNEDAGLREVGSKIAQQKQAVEPEVKDAPVEEPSATDIGFTTSLRQKWAELVGTA